MTDYAALLTFPNTSTTYEAATKLDNDAAGLGVSAAALVERDADGHLTVPDGIDLNAGRGLWGGSLFGMLVGVLGGPLGMLFGLAAGAAGGSLIDAQRVETGDDVVSTFARLVPPGGNAIVAQTDGEHSAALDSFVEGLGGTITTRPLDEVLAELEAQDDAARAAAEAARHQLREAKKQERHEKFEERIDALKARFHRS